MKNSDYYYEFKVVDNNKEITHRMNAECDSTEMYYFIKEFLLAASWQPDTVDEIIGKED